MQTATLGFDEWTDTLERLVEWTEFLDVSPREAFDRIAKLLASEHFGVEYCSLDNFEDFSSDDPPEMGYLNQGETYATTLILTDDYVNGVKLLVSSWGDWYETNETHHQLESNVVRCGYCSHFTPFDWSSGDDLDNCRCDFCGHKVTGGD